MYLSISLIFPRYKNSHVTNSRKIRRKKKRFLDSPERATDQNPLSDESFSAFNTGISPRIVHSFASRLPKHFIKLVSCAISDIIFFQGELRECEVKVEKCKKRNFSLYRDARCIQLSNITKHVKIGRRSSRQEH